MRNKNYKYCPQCRKNVYRTMSAAEYFAEHRSNDYATLHVYPCHHGNGFHVSKSTAPYKKSLLSGFVPLYEPGYPEVGSHHLWVPTPLSGGTHGGMARTQSS